MTDDYGYLNISEPFQAEDEGLARSVVYPDDLLRYFPLWDSKIEAALRCLESVEQPLINLVPARFQKLVKAKLQKGEAFDSILELYYSGK